MPPSYRKKRAKKVLLIVGVILLLAALAVGFFFAKKPLEEALERFRGVFHGGAGGSGFAVHYIDVGQADAALVLCDGQAMLIDGGQQGRRRGHIPVSQRAGREGAFLHRGHPSP